MKSHMNRHYAVEPPAAWRLMQVKAGEPASADLAGLR